MSIIFHSVLIVLFMAASAIFSGLEIGGYSLNRLTLRSRARQRNRKAVRLQRMLQDAHLFIFTVLIGNNIAIYLLSRHVTNLYAGSGRFSTETVPFLNAETAATLTLMLPLFFFAELLPKNLFRMQADTLMYRFSGVLCFFQWVFSPLSLFLKAVFRLLTAGRVQAEALSSFSLSLDGFREYFEGETSGKVLSAHQHDMIDNLIAMHRISVHQIMQPVKGAPAVSEKASIQEAINRMRERNTDQILLYRGSPRHPIGWVNLFDLMDPSIKSSDPVKPRLRKMIRMPSSLSLNKALHRLRVDPKAPALVVTRSSRAVGLLYLHDVARHIVSPA